MFPRKPGLQGRAPSFSDRGRWVPAFAVAVPMYLYPHNVAAAG
jgi:hypothetical protein